MHPLSTEGFEKNFRTQIWSQLQRKRQQHSFDVAPQSPLQLFSKLQLPRNLKRNSVFHSPHFMWRNSTYFKEKNHLRIENKNREATLHFTEILYNYTHTKKIYFSGGGSSVGAGNWEYWREPEAALASRLLPTEIRTLHSKFILTH